MNKAVSVHLGGLFFHFEEQAYHTLSEYLHGIRRHFASEEGCSEIVEDIESRLSEMFQENLVQSKRQVILGSDVQRAIQIMGSPEQMDNPDAEILHLSANDLIKGKITHSADEKNAENKSEGNRSRRLYRNADDKVIGGVCSGIAAYFGIEDPVWIRLALALLFFSSFGSLVPVYILLMVIVPVATTSAQKLSMRGEPITISNIEKTFREGFETVQARFAEFSQADNEGDKNGQNKKKVSTFFEQTRNAAAQAQETFSRTYPQMISPMLRLAKWALMAVGVVVLFSLAMSLVAVVVGFLGSIQFFSQFIFNSFMPVLFATLNLAGLILIPLLFVSYYLLKKSFNMSSYNTRNWRASLGALWLVCLLGFVSISASTYKQNFDVKTTKLEIKNLASPANNTIYIALKDADPAIDEIRANNSSAVGVDIDDMVFDYETGNMYGSGVTLDVERGNTPDFQLVEKMSALGGDKHIANENAQKLTYLFDQIDSVLYLPKHFFAGQGKWRGQDLHLTLRVPIGKSVHFLPGSEDIIYDVKNVKNVFDGDMIGKTWVMTPAGLEQTSNENEIKEEGVALEQIPSIDAQQINEQKEQPLGSGETEKVYEIRDFSEIEASGSLEVKVIQGSEFSVKITGKTETLEKINVEKNGNVLQIERGIQWKLFGSNNGNGTVRVSITMPELERMQLSGATEGVFSGFTNDNMALEVFGASELRGSLKTNELSIDLSGASSMKLNGNANSMTVDVSGASELDAFELVSEKAEVDASGASEANINVNNELNAEASGASSISYKGSPKEASTESNGASSVRKVD